MKKIYVNSVLLLIIFVLITPVNVNSQAKVKYPDLQVTNILLGGNCQIYLTITNNGPGKLMPSAYDLKNGVSIQMYRGTTAWGGIRLAGVDSGKVLVNPGGRITIKWFPLAANLKLPEGASELKAVIDNYNVVREVNETNNTLSKRVICLAMALITDVAPDECKPSLASNTSRCFEIYGENFGSVPAQVYINSTQVNYVAMNNDWNTNYIIAGAHVSVFDLGRRNYAYFKRNNEIVSNKKAFIPWASLYDLSPASLKKSASSTRLSKLPLVEIKAAYLSGLKSGYEVYFGKTLMPMVSFSKVDDYHLIKVRIPSDLPPGKHIVRMKTGTYYITSPAWQTPVFEYK